jgi:hypothetical protein
MGRPNFIHYTMLWGKMQHVGALASTLAKGLDEGLIDSLWWPWRMSIFDVH